MSCAGCGLPFTGSHTTCAGARPYCPCACHTDDTPLYSRVDYQSPWQYNSGPIPAKDPDEPKFVYRQYKFKNRPVKTNTTYKTFSYKEIQKAKKKRRKEMMQREFNAFKECICTCTIV